MIIDTNRPQHRKRKNNYYIYVLKLEEGKYYVGLSHNVKKRFQTHLSGQGAKWTKIYKPIKILESKETPYYSYSHAGPLEDKKTIEIMEKYGKNNVRGGIYSAVDQRKVDELLGKKFNYLNNIQTQLDEKQKQIKIKDEIYQKKLSEQEDRLDEIKDYRIQTFTEDIQISNEEETEKMQLILNKKNTINIYIDDEFKVIWIERKLFRQFRNRLSYFFVNVTPKTSNKRKKKNQ